MQNVSKKEMRLAVISSLVGSMLEFYDFQIYGMAAALVFNILFFPDVDPTTALLASFATFGVGFIARPLGGMFFGYLGDIIGRKKTLVITLIGMGIVSCLTGLLPGYMQIGLWAPALLVLLRFLQGFLVGGEWGGAALLVYEYAPPHRRGFFGVFPQIGGFLGNLLSAGTFALVTLLPQDDLLSWGWRIPFLSSAILLGVGLFVRAKLDETPAFKEMQRQELILKDQKTKKTIPTVEVIKNSWRSILTIMLLRLGESVPYYVVTVFAVSYASTLGIERGTMLLAIVLVCILACPMHLLYGALSDKIGRRKIYLFGAIVAAISPFPFFWALESHSFVLMLLGYVLVINIAHNAINSMQPSLFSELFNTKVRYSGISIGSQFGAILAGGFTPLIATSLARYDGGHWTLVALYVTAASMVTVLTAFFLKERHGRHAEKPLTRQGNVSVDAAD
ncbi:Major facilitator superfamily transporter [Sodalis praecaptivus]|uniref:Major facilitator superfamily transporter n=1 Tax=Sodalis praecaptivus TaxID=1239307 RepID=W0HNI8_9GAMM|nr:MFS transporter [Sodalis praecaptivus]AHF75416.1 Major facilitator superfamily transporter [Sodalis praecaptivus]